MEEKTMFDERFEAMTAEQQKLFVNNLFTQNQQLVSRIRQIEDTTMFRKLDYLFKIVDMGTFSETTTARCVGEIELIMFGEDPTNEPEKGEES